MPKFPKFPPELPFGPKSRTWVTRLSEEDKDFIAKELVGQGFLTIPSEETYDEDIARAIEGDFRDMEHNANRPWDSNFTQTCRKLDDILEKIGYYLVIDYEVRKLER